MTTLKQLVYILSNYIWVILFIQGKEGTERQTELEAKVFVLH